MSMLAFYKGIYHDKIDWFFAAISEIDACAIDDAMTHSRRCILHLIISPRHHGIVASHGGYYSEACLLLLNR